MIITLDNPESDRIAASVPFINVSWLSRYPDEDERIFAGLIDALLISSAVPQTIILLCCIPYKVEPTQSKSNQYVSLRPVVIMRLHLKRCIVWI